MVRGGEWRLLLVEWEFRGLGEGGGVWRSGLGGGYDRWRRGLLVRVRVVKKVLLGDIGGLACGFAMCLKGINLVNANQVESNGENHIRIVPKSRASFGDKSQEGVAPVHIPVGISF